MARRGRSRRLYGTAMAGGSGPVPELPFPADIAGLELWLEASAANVTLVGSKVSAWADIAGGPVTSVDQATDALRLTYATGGLNGKPYLSGTTSTFLASATSLFAAGAARTVFVAAHATDGTGGRLLQFRTAAPYCALSATTNPALEFTWDVHGDGSLVNKLNDPPALASPHCYAFKYVAGAPIPQMDVDGVEQVMSTKETANVDLSASDSGTAGIIVGGHLGRIYEVVAYAGLLSDVDARRVLAYLGSKFAISIAAVSTRDRVMFDGDSITQGVGVPLSSQSYPSQTRALLGGVYDIGNTGLGGSGSQRNAQMAPKQVDPRFDTARSRNIDMLLIGTNDIASGSNENDVYANILLWVNDRKNNAAGVPLVCVGTLTGRADAGWDAGKELVRVALNNLIRANSAGAHQLVDFAADPRLDVATLTYFQDLLHPNAAGYAVMAEIMAAAIPAPAWSLADESDVRVWKRGGSWVVSGGLVDEWTDLSPQGNDSANVLLLRPPIISDWRNGFPAVGFTNTTWLESSTSALASAGSQYTVVFVGQAELLDADDSGGAFFCERKGSLYAAHMHYKFLTHYIYGDGVNAAQNIEMVPQRFPEVNAPFQSVRLMNGPGVAPTVYINGTISTIPTGVQGTEDGLPGYYEGRNPQTPPLQSWNGPVGEYAVIAGVKDFAFRMRWARYCWERWRMK